jgi:hypothetical protein
MPKVPCRCGHVFNLSETESSEYSLVAETVIEDIIENVENKTLTPDTLGQLLEATIGVLKCPVCKRLLLSEDTATSRYVFYSREAL